MLRNIAQRTAAKASRSSTRSTALAPALVSVSSPSLFFTTAPLPRSSCRTIFTHANWGKNKPPTAPVYLAFDVIEPSEDKRPGENLVVCHGLFGSKQNWRTLARRFSKELGMRVYTVDLRNHGLSPHAEPHTSVAIATDLAYLFRRQGMEKVHLVGHSMGGKAVMALALNADLNGRLASLVPVDMSPRSEPIEQQYTDYAQGMKEIAAAGVQTRQEADEILEKYEPLLSTRQFLLTNAVTTTNAAGNKVLGFRIPLDILHRAIPHLGEFPYTPPPPVTPHSPQWFGPTLFIRGANADYVRDDNLPTCRAFFPNMELVTLDTGHWVHAEKPQETGDAIVEFIRGVEVKFDRKRGRSEGDVALLD